MQERLRSACTPGWKLSESRAGASLVPCAVTVPPPSDRGLILCPSPVQSSWSPGRDSHLSSHSSWKPPPPISSLELRVQNSEVSLQPFLSGFPERPQALVSGTHRQGLNSRGSTWHLKPAGGAGSPSSCRTPGPAVLLNGLGWLPRPRFSHLYSGSQDQVM